MDDATRRVGAEGPRATGRPRAATKTSDSDQRSQEIREEIAQTRDDMSDTIDAIQDRLTPANLVAQAGETVRNAATAKVKQMANTAGNAADQVLGSSFMDTVRSNPLPAALIGLGVAWMIFNSRSKSGNGRGSNRSSSQPDWRTLAATGMHDEASEGVVGTSRTAGSERGVREYTGEIASRAKDVVGSVRDSADRTGRRARVSFDRVMRESPLALGAAAAIVGAAVGVSIPTTDAENEFMGDARDTVVDRARHLAGDAADRVSDAAGQVKDIASRAASTTAPRPVSSGQE
jgi:hypothetical protein